MFRDVRRHVYKDFIWNRVLMAFHFLSQGLRENETCIKKSVALVRKYSSVCTDSFAFNRIYPDFIRCADNL